MDKFTPTFIVYAHFQLNRAGMDTSMNGNDFPCKALIKPVGLGHANKLVCFPGNLFTKIDEQ